MVNTILKEAGLFCPNSVRINFTIYRSDQLVRLGRLHLDARWGHYPAC
ncbi:ABC transporter ATP-binding protein [Pediococcus pentosaceus]|nr:ABC transporter ATP-binding protein [Pediococcus pentosaceus]